MPYSREKFSLSILIVWVILFFGGMIGLFSFLLGNPFFSGEITGKYFFSSEENSSLFINEEFVGKKSSDEVIPLGIWKFCASEYFFKTRCFDGEIRSNSFSVLDLKEVSLFPRDFRIDTITSEKVYFDPVGNGFFWIDNEKKVIWGMKKGEENFFTQKLIFKEDDEYVKKNQLYRSSEGLEMYSVSYDVEIKKFIITYFHDRKLISSSVLPIFVEFPESFIDFSGVASILRNKKSDVLISSLQVLKVSNKSDKKKILASFSTPVQKVIPFRKNKIIEFFDSVWIFTPERNQFLKILSKDAGSRIFWNKETSSIFFISDKKLKRLFLR